MMPYATERRRFKKKFHWGKASFIISISYHKMSKVTQVFENFTRNSWFEGKLDKFALLFLANATIIRKNMRILR